MADEVNGDELELASVDEALREACAQQILPAEARQQAEPKLEFVGFRQPVPAL